MDQLFPLILKQNFKCQNCLNLENFVIPMKNYVIQPFKMNMFHYYAFWNHGDCVDIALVNNSQYLTDNFNRTPLFYALERRALSCVNVFLSQAVYKPSFFKNLKPDEVIDILECNPKSLPTFFKEASDVFISPEVPRFAKIKKVIMLSKELSLSN